MKQKQFLYTLFIIAIAHPLIQACDKESHTRDPYDPSYLYRDSLAAINFTEMKEDLAELAAECSYEFKNLYYCFLCQKECSFYLELLEHFQYCNNQSKPMVTSTSSTVSSAAINHSSNFKTDKAQRNKKRKPSCQHPGYNQSFTSPSNRRNRHIKKNHMKEREIFICQYCGICFKQASDLNHHEKSIHKIRDYFCAACNVLFKNQDNSSIKKHCQRHIVTCEKCGKDFRQYSTRNEHEDLLCRTCKTLYKANANLIKWHKEYKEKYQKSH